MKSMTVLHSWIVPLRREFPALARGGAWLFAVGSLFPLLWLISQGARGDVFHATVRGESHSVWLLHYQDFLGGALLWIELLGITAAVAATVLPGVPLKFRRFGHGTLIGWNALWMLGTVRLGLIAPGLFTVQGLFLAALFACTVNRAWLNWNGKTSSSRDRMTPKPPSPSSSPTDVADTQRLLRSSEVESGPAVDELRSPPPDANYFAPPPRSPSRAAIVNAHGRKALLMAVKHSLDAMKLAARKTRTLASQTVAAIRAHRAASATTSPPTSSA